MSENKIVKLELEEYSTDTFTTEFELEEEFQVIRMDVSDFQALLKAARDKQALDKIEKSSLEENLLATFEVVEE